MNNSCLKQYVWITVVSSSMYRRRCWRDEGRKWWRNWFSFHTYSACDTTVTVDWELKKKKTIKIKFKKKNIKKKQRSKHIKGSKEGYWLGQTQHANFQGNPPFSSYKTKLKQQLFKRRFVACKREMVLFTEHTWRCLL